MTRATLPARRLFLAALLLAPAALSTARAASAADLTVDVIGVQPDKGGDLWLGLYTGARDFPDPTAATATLRRPAQSQRVVFSDLTPGTYAVMVYQDENGNGRLDRFMGMVPTEGYGLSNNPTLRGRPTFRQCAVSLPVQGMRIRITMKY